MHNKKPMRLYWNSLPKYTMSTGHYDMEALSALPALCEWNPPCFSTFLMVLFLVIFICAISTFSQFLSSLDFGLYEMIVMIHIRYQDIIGTNEDLLSIGLQEKKSVSAIISQIAITDLMQGVIHSLWVASPHKRLVRQTAFPWHGVCMMGAQCHVP